MRHSPTDRPVVVFDVLGTLVDQAGSLEREVATLIGAADTAAELVRDWLGHVAESERAINGGRRDFAPSHELDADALRELAAAGRLSHEHADTLASAHQRLRPWPDTPSGLDRLAADLTVTGLSNASRRALAGLSANSGMRWHQVLSAEDAGRYKPDPAIYRLAVAAVPADAGPPFMVAAHAWDLRAAAAAGMRTAYVPRPDGDPPAPGERFDVHAADLAELHERLRAR